MVKELRSHTQGKESFLRSVSLGLPGLSLLGLVPTLQVESYKQELSARTLTTAALALIQGVSSVGDLQPNHPNALLKCMLMRF